jgi:PIN domain nuclease of toxin-antitoxin system
VKVLLDTHAFIWWMEAADRLPRNAMAVIAGSENQVLISAVVAWEIAIKVNLGKITASVSIDELARVIRDQGFDELAISLDHAVRAGSLPPHHSDPFDRMLIAQALVEDVPIVSNDRAFDAYGVRRLW